VSTRKFQEIWVEQCDATHEIKLRYGVKAAFDYLVAEKLLNFAECCDQPLSASRLSTPPRTTMKKTMSSTMTMS
jgi:hypothetical protein